MNLLQNEIGTWMPGVPVWVVVPKEGGGLKVTRAEKRAGRRVMWHWDHSYRTNTPEPRDTFASEREAWLEVNKRLAEWKAEAEKQI